MIDLHIHTNCSDGVLSPEEIVNLAADRGVRAIAITDHDTIDGNERAMRAGALKNISVVPGIEISAQWGGFSCHVLGYGIRQTNIEVKEAFEFFRESRTKRNKQILSRLRDLGIDIRMEDVLSEAGGSIVGRPHFARALVKKKAAASSMEAFVNYLGKGAAAFMDKQRLSTAEACKIIHKADGAAVLAHPGQFEKSNPGVLEKLLANMVSQGLDGIEAHYSRHSLEQTRQCLRMAKRHKLLVTGGSDFHRSGHNLPELGWGMGSLRTPYSCYEALAKRLSDKQGRPGT